MGGLADARLFSLARWLLFLTVDLIATGLVCVRFMSSPVPLTWHGVQ